MRTSATRQIMAATLLKGGGIIIPEGFPDALSNDDNGFAAGDEAGSVLAFYVVFEYRSSLCSQ